jgi:hypothetical protein
LDVLDEQMSAREERDEGELHRLVLAFECPLDRVPELLNERELFGGQVGRGSHGSRE